MHNKSTVPIPAPSGTTNCCPDVKKATASEFELEQLDQAVISTLRSMSRQGRSPSEMFRELKRCLGMETHIVTLLNYFRQAFCLTLAEAKPIAPLSRNEQREIEDKTLLDELLLPAILNHRSDWEGQ